MPTVLWQFLSPTDFVCLCNDRAERMLGNRFRPEVRQTPDSLPTSLKKRRKNTLSTILTAEDRKETSPDEKLLPLWILGETYWNDLSIELTLHSLHQSDDILGQENPFVNCCRLWNGNDTKIFSLLAWSYLFHLSLSLSLFPPSLSLSLSPPLFPWIYKYNSYRLWKWIRKTEFKSRMRLFAS